MHVEFVPWNAHRVSCLLSASEREAVEEGVSRRSLASWKRVHSTIGIDNRGLCGILRPWKKKNLPQTTAEAEGSLVDPALGDELALCPPQLLRLNRPCRGLWNGRGRDAPAGDWLATLKKEFLEVKQNQVEQRRGLDIVKTTVV